MGPQGPSLDWARRVNHCLRVSLRELAAYLVERPEHDCIQVLRASMVLGPAAQTA
jgi:hypothetical protein